MTRRSIPGKHPTTPRPSRYLGHKSTDTVSPLTDPICLPLLQFLTIACPHMAGSSSGRSPQNAPPLSLPPAVLHTSSDPHPDSAEAVDRERNSFAQELSPINQPTSHEIYSPSPVREPSLRTSVSHTPSEETATTATDPLGPSARDLRRYRLQRQVPHWYDPVVKFWTTHIRVVVDERVGGSHRDHLGLSIFSGLASSKINEECST